jgi:hypothetical protein
MAIPNSRQSLIDYCKRALGHPVINIDVADEQIQDRVDEALHFYREFHGDGVTRDYYKHKVTALDKQRQYIEIPEEISQIIRVLTAPALANWGGMFSFTYQFFLNDFYRPGGIGLGGNLSNYDITMQYLNLIDHFFNQEKTVHFARNENKLRINIDWNKVVKVDSYFIIECYRIIDPEVHTKMWNDLWLKKYLTALIKLQWGENLKKYSDVSLIGGVKLNADKIYEEAKIEKETLEKQAQDTWQLPIDFMIG